MERIGAGGRVPDLPSATKIGVTSKTGRDVSRGFDSVLLPGGQRCTIAEIRPIDYERMKKEEQEMRGSERTVPVAQYKLALGPR